jgi:hypothetical protein
MEFIKLTCQDPILENGSHKIVFHAQWNNFFLNASFVFLPNTINSSILFNIIDQFMNSGEMICIKTRLFISCLSKSSESTCNTITPTTTPRHSLILDSSVLNPHGFLEPSVNSFGIDPSHFRENFRPLSNFLYNHFSLLFSQQGEYVNFVAQTNFYDLRAT